MIGYKGQVKLVGSRHEGTHKMPSGIRSQSLHAKLLHSDNKPGMRKGRG